MNKVKVLHLHTLPVVSGSGINTYLTMKGTPGDRFDVALAGAPGGRLNEIIREAGMTVHEIPSLVQPLHPLKDVSALLKMIQIIRKEKVHILHTHNSKTGFLGRLAGRITRTPVVIHTVHGFAFHDAESRWRRNLYRILERTATPWADHTIFISQPMIDWAHREGMLKQGRYSKIFSGIDLKVFVPCWNEEKEDLREQFGLHKGDRAIGFVSKLWEGKGHEVAIQAMASVVERVPRAKLVLVGEGLLEQRLRDMSRRLGIQDAIIFGGFHTRIADITSLFDLCILPSFFEGMGRVLLEAGACGKPVVASNVGGIPDVVDDGVTGFLVPPGDSLSLSRKILRLLEEPHLAHRMGLAARERINEKFDVRTMVREIVDLYETCLSRKGLNMRDQGETASILEQKNRQRKAV